MRHYYKISEIAQLYSIGPDSLRYYEEAGLLSPKRDENGYRMYSIDDIWKLNIRLHATAHCFRRNHRLRLVVASGQHPRYARNTGTDEPLGDATQLVAADVEIFHDPQHPSTIHLPVFEIDAASRLQS